MSRRRSTAVLAVAASLVLAFGGILAQHVLDEQFKSNVSVRRQHLPFRPSHFSEI